METRRISSNEFEVLQTWLDHDVAGAAVLRGQLAPDMKVYRSCDCGCASIGFVNIEDGPELGLSVFDVDAEIVDRSGVSVGGMMLTIRNGRLHDVDVYSWFDKVPFPAVDQIRWQPRAAASDCR